MSDLISREALIKVVEADINRCYALRIDGVGALSHFIDQIKKQPTAYNLEEVVKELEEYVEQHKDYYQIGEDFLGYGACISAKKAIEIVRKGGVKNE